MPNTSIVDVMVQKAVRLLPVDGPEAEKLMADYSFYTPSTVTKDTYKTTPM